MAIDISTSLLALLPTAAALGGVYLKARIDRTDKIDDRLAKQKENEVNRREQRIEQLYDDVDNYASWAVRNCINYEFWINKKIDAKNLMNMIEKDNENVRHNSTRMKFIISRYFPHILDDFNDLHDAASETINIAHGFDIIGLTEKNSRPEEDICKLFSSKKVDLQNKRVKILDKIAGLQ